MLWSSNCLLTYYVYIRRDWPNRCIEYILLTKLHCRFRQLLCFQNQITHSWDTLIQQVLSLKTEILMIFGVTKLICRLTPKHWFLHLDLLSRWKHTYRPRISCACFQMLSRGFHSMELVKAGSGLPQWVLFEGEFAVEWTRANSLGQVPRFISGRTFEEKAASKSHLMLHFDINKTILISDKATGATQSDMVNVLLSECAWGRMTQGPSWTPVGRLATDRPVKDPQLMTYRNFLDSFAFPYLEGGGRPDIQIENKRRKQECYTRQRAFTSPGMCSTVQLCNPCSYVCTDLSLITRTSQE